MPRTRHLTRRGCCALLATAMSAQLRVPKPPVILDQDGGMPDDYLATALLMTFDQFDPLGVVVTPADCFPKPAASATRKVLGLMGKAYIPVVESTVKGIHAFPAEWRTASNEMDHIRSLYGLSARPTPGLGTGQRFLANRLREAEAPVTLLVTGPLSTVAAALEIAPEVEQQIQRIIWMGGALDAPGNVDSKTETNSDGSAEWNAYWDAVAVAKVWQTPIPFTICPLDVTNKVPVTAAVVKRWEQQRAYAVSRLAAEAYGPLAGKEGVYFWDLLATAYLGNPGLFRTKPAELEIITEGPAEGRIVKKAGGRRATVLTQVDVEAFYEYLTTQFRT